MQKKRVFTAVPLVLLILCISPFIAVGGADGQEMVTICHNPGPHEVTIEVAGEAVDAHAAHGDTVGFPCGTIFAECTAEFDTWHTATFATYVLEVDEETLGGLFTGIDIIGRVDESLSVFVTSLSSGNTWSFTEPYCFPMGCSYALDWYGEELDPIGEGAGTYKLEISQAEEGPVNVYCFD